MRGAKRAPPSARRRTRSVHGFVRAQPKTPSYHASGKEALRVGLSLLDRTDGDDVLIPSYVPVGVAHAVLAAGATPRYYPVESASEPDVDALKSAISKETGAVLAVQYFGFVQERMSELRRLTREYDVALVDDASHGPLSSVDRRALGTFGDVGFASFHKPLRVPDGAVLYVDESSPAIDRRFAKAERTRWLNSSRPRPGASDARYRAAVAGTELRNRVPALRAVDSALEGLLRGSDTDTDVDADDGAGGEPGAGSDAEWRGEMSWTTWRALRRTDRGDVRRARRDAYRAWMARAADCPAVEPVFEDLPPGVCPWVFPVRVGADADRLRDRLEAVDGAFAWPTLPDAVEGNERYRTANRLSRSVVCLPLKEMPDEERIERLFEVAAV